MLYGPIYCVLVKELWVNASIKKIGQDVFEIDYDVFVFPIIITPPIIAKEIKCEDNGFFVEPFKRKNSFISNILRCIYANYEKPAGASTITLMEKTWHQLLVINFLLREKGMNLITFDDKHLLYFHKG